MSGKRIAYVVFVILVAGLSALGGALAGGSAVYRAIGSTPAAVQAPQAAALPTPVIRNLRIDTTTFESNVIDAVEKVGSAVVTVVGVVPGGFSFFGGGVQDNRTSGSGVFISEDGYVLTNNHVVEDATSLSLILASGEEIPAKVVGTDIYADLAVLKAEGKVPAVAVLGNSDVLKPGQTVIAIGSPLGDFKNTVTLGVVSATERSLDSGKGYTIEGLVQTDAAINQGNSGGPLLNLAGEVIGINTLVVRGNQYGGSAIAEGLGFAIPVNTARAVAEQIIAKGYFSRPFIGIRWQTISPQINAMYNLGVEWGIYVTEVTTGSPADEAGLREGDIITHIGEIELDGEHSFINALFTYKPGDVIPLEVVREGQKTTIQVTLGEAPAQ